VRFIREAALIENLQRSSARAVIQKRKAAGLKRIGILASGPSVASLSVGRASTPSFTECLH
jgi:hypothetical protein